MDNKNYVAIPADVVTQVVDKLKEIDGLLAPYCVTLTVTERKEILKMGDNTLAFVQKAFEFAQQNAEFLPSYVSMEEWKIDMDDTVTTKQIDSVLGRVVEKVSDTRIEAGHEALKAALAYYHNVSRAATDGITGAKPIYDELKKRYARGRKKNDSGEE